MPYIGTQPTKVVSRQSANVYRYEATAGQTAFTGADLDNNVLACNPADMIVHMNGLRLESTDYTATSTTVTLTTAATAGDEVTVTSFQTFEVADTYTKTTADNRYVNTTGDTMTGNLGIGTNSTSTELTIGAAGTPQIDLFNTTSADVLANLRAEVDVGTGGSLVFQTKRNGNTPVDVIKADSAGRVTMPYQPAFNATAGGSTSLGLYWQKIDYSQQVTQTGNHYNATNYRFTAPVNGWYQFNASWSAENNSDIDGTFILALNNNVSANVGAVSMANTGPNYEGHAVSACAYLNANDYIEVWRYSTVNTTTRTFDWSGNFSGYLIG